MKEIKSKNLSHVGYEGDSKKGTLKIRFKSGAEWHYADVPAEIHEELMNAESAGAYFLANIRGQYEGKKHGD